MQIDRFIPTVNPSANRWDLSDGWVATGGKWIHLEFSNTRNSIGIWQRYDSNPTIRINDIPYEGVIEAVFHENRSTSEGVEEVFESLVYVTLKLPVTIKRTDTVKIDPLQIVATNQEMDSDARVNSFVSVTLRNYANCDASGNPLLPLRGTSLPNHKKTDPRYATNKLFFLRSQDTNATEIATGQWSTGISGSTTRIVTEVGSMQYNSVDTDFAGNPSITLSQNFVGPFANFFLSQTQINNGFTFIAVYKPLNQETAFNLGYIRFEAGSGSSTGSGTSVDDPSTSFEFANILGSVPGSRGSGLSGFNVFVDPFWTLYSDDTSRNYLNIDTSKTVERTRGNGNGRSSTGAVSWNGEKTTFYTFSGHPIGNELTDSDEVFEINPIWNRFGVFVGFGACKVTEVYGFSGQLSETTIREYCAFLDEKYGSGSAKAFYVDPTSGLDTNSGIDSSNPLKTINKAKTKIYFGAGDQILLKNTEDFTQSDPIVIGSDSNIEAPFGYSPDFPFVLGYYGTRSNGRPTIDYGHTSASFVDITTPLILTQINGVEFKSTERNPLHSSYVGYVTYGDASNISAGYGYGIKAYTESNATHYTPDGLFVTDCNLSFTGRHAIALGKYGQTFATHLKYSGVYQNDIHNLWNPNNVINSDPLITGITNSHGIAGVYSESVGGLHVEDNIFHRCGWYEGMTASDFITGSYITNGPTIDYITVANLQSKLNRFIPYNQYTTNEKQRLEVKFVGGVGVSSAYDLINKPNILSIIGNTIALCPVCLNDEVIAALGLYDGATIGFYILDGAPRNSGNADIIINGPGTSNNITVKSMGPYVFVNNMHIESSGYHVLSDASYLSYNNIIEGNLFGSAISPEYTYLKNSYYGGSVGDIIRRKPISNTVGITHTIGRIQTGYYDSNHTWYVKYPSHNSNIYADVSYNIFTSPNEMGITGSETINPDSVIGGKYPSCHIFFDENKDFSEINTKIYHNTFMKNPGSLFVFSQEQTEDYISLRRNLLLQPKDFYPTGRGNWIYSFENPFTGSIANPITVIDEIGMYNIYFATTSDAVNDISEDVRFWVWVSDQMEGATNGYDYTEPFWTKQNVYPLIVANPRFPDLPNNNAYGNTYGDLAIIDGISGADWEAVGYQFYDWAEYTLREINKRTNRSISSLQYAFWFNGAMIANDDDYCSEKRNVRALMRSPDDGIEEFVNSTCEISNGVYYSSNGIANNVALFTDFINIFESQRSAATYGIPEPTYVFSDLESGDQVAVDKINQWWTPFIADSRFNTELIDGINTLGKLFEGAPNDNYGSPANGFGNPFATDNTWIEWAQGINRTATDYALGKVYDVLKAEWVNMKWGNYRFQPSTVTNPYIGVQGRLNVNTTLNKSDFASPVFYGLRLSQYRNRVDHWHDVLDVTQLPVITNGLSDSNFVKNWRAVNIAIALFNLRSCIANGITCIPWIGIESTPGLIETEFIDGATYSIARLSNENIIQLMDQCIALGVRDFIMFSGGTEAWGDILDGLNSNAVVSSDNVMFLQTYNGVGNVNDYRLTFDEWRTLSGDMSVFKEVEFVTGARYPATYNGNTNAFAFATNAILERQTRSTSTYLVSNVMSFITAGYQPSNLLKINYNNDYVGAVDFFEIITSGFKPAFTDNTTELDFGFTSML